jgi:transposase
MSVVLMSKRELNRLDVLARLDSDRLTVLAAAGLMNVTRRQTYRLLSRYRDGGAPAIADQRRGRPSNNRLPDAVRDHAISLVRQLYSDFGPTLAAEKLAERHDLKVSRETLRNWMRQAGIWVSRAERLRFQQPRHRREHVEHLRECWRANFFEVSLPPQRPSSPIFALPTRSAGGFSINQAAALRSLGSSIGGNAPLLPRNTVLV